MSCLTIGTTGFLFLPAGVVVYPRSVKYQLLARSVCLPLLMGLTQCDSKDRKAEESPPTPSAKASAAPPAPTTAPPEQPKAVAVEEKKPKRRAEDCPKGPTFEFTHKAIEDEVRRKLQKPEGAVAKADLKRIRSLNLSQVKLEELDVCLFPHLSGLKDLFLGAGSYDDLSPLATANQLESLRASLSQVKDLQPLSKMKKLDRLDLGHTQVSDLSPLSELTSLTELQIDNTPVVDLSPLAKLTKLESLSIKNTSVKDVSALKDLKKLKTLYAAGTPADEDPMAFQAVRGNGTKIINR